jgi:mutator protein MutT
MESRIYCQRCGGFTELRPVEDRPRPVCTVCGAVTYFDPKLAVAVVLEREGKILLGQRGQNTRAPGKWSFPAGFVERGEQVESAAIRETREETGVVAELGPLVGLFSHEGEAVVLAVYAASGFAGEPAASDDLDAVGWFSLDALPELAFDHDPAIVRAWKSWFDSVVRAE